MRRVVIAVITKGRQRKRQQHRQLRLPHRLTNAGTRVYIVLIAALMNASWNALVKSGGDKLLTVVMITTAAAGVAALALPFLPQPAPASWPFIGGSVLLQTLYYALLVAAYRSGDMSHVYPIMRGTAPLIVAALSAALIGEAVSGARWLGIGLICGGVLGLALHRPAHSVTHRTATAFALGNACVIASYTMTDGLGVRRSGAPAAYALWIFLLNGIEQLL
jgi:drug/metabolite transporter (DMT)-like permease